MKSACKPHIIDLLHLHALERIVNGDDMSIDARRATLIVGSAAEGQDLAGERIVHDSVTVHRVTIVGAIASSGLPAVTIGAIPIHCATRASLEDCPVLPSKDPAVVVGTVDASVVVGQHRTDRAIRQRLPRVAVGVIYFAVLATLSTGPGATDHEGAPVREGALRLVAAASDHIRSAVPLIEGRVIHAGSLIVVSTSDEEAPAKIERQAGTEHVVVCVGDDSLSDGLGKGVIAGCHGQTTVSVGEGAGLV